MNHYCTLFDSGYLTRGLALYQSLIDSGEDFFLYVIAFDEEAYRILTKLNLDRAKIISLTEFEDERLLAIKRDRTHQEYSWTCGCFSILYVIKTFGLNELTYLDADIFFFNKASILLNEFYETGKDVLITGHNYTPKYDQTATSGKFCVQFMTFKNNSNGMNVLNWWCDRCEEWCYARMEDGKFGDQKYLDDWEDRFNCVHVLQNIGGGVAPWNVQQFTVQSGPQINNLPVVFYHFHALAWLAYNNFDVSQYELSRTTKEYIYRPYLVALQEAYKLIVKCEPDFNMKYQAKRSGFFNRWKRRVRGNYNIMNI